MADLLVVTPTLGESRFLDSTLESFEIQGSNAACVLVAPGKVYAHLTRRFPKHRITQETGNGMYAALNTGLRSCTAESWEWFSYLNDDDVWLSGISNALAHARRGIPRAAIVYGRVSLIGSRGEPLGALPVARSPTDLCALLSRGIIPIAQPGTLIHREVVERLGGFDESYRSAGDLDFFVRALAAGVRFEFVNHEVAAFRLHSNQISKDEITAREEKARALMGLPRPKRNVTAAFVRFRAANLGAYLDRVRRFGFTRMKEIYRS